MLGSFRCIQTLLAVQKSWEISEPETSSSTEGSGGGCICHENVTQRAENGGKKPANDNKGRRKQVAGICANLLNSFD